MGRGFQQQSVFNCLWENQMKILYFESERKIFKISRPVSILSHFGLICLHGLKGTFRAFIKSNAALKGQTLVDVNVVKVGADFRCSAWQLKALQSLFHLRLNEIKLFLLYVLCDTMEPVKTSLRWTNDVLSVLSTYHTLYHSSLVPFYERHRLNSSRYICSYYFLQSFDLKKLILK